MKRGVILIAHNNEKINYYDLAVYTASRIHKFLDLPVSLITNESSLGTSTIFDQTFLINPNKSNVRHKSTWINKDRYTVYDYSPYDETIVLDVDYMINSSNLLKTFQYESDFLCHHDIRFFIEGTTQEIISKKSFVSHWATVMRFKKTKRVQQIFELMKMIQNNYEHYCTLHNFIGSIYRNDYALTIALRTANGQFVSIKDNIPWKLMHVHQKSIVYRDSDTAYTIVHEEEEKLKYIKIKDIDFHMLNKKNFVEIMQ